MEMMRFIFIVNVNIETWTFQTYHVITFRDQLKLSNFKADKKYFKKTLFPKFLIFLKKMGKSLKVYIWGVILYWFFSCNV